MTKRIHILGICGTFMGGLAVLAKQMGYEVTGSDAHVYPPMSHLLQKAGIALCEGYEPAHLRSRPDLVIVGNAISRGNSMLEFILDEKIPYTSGPQWLFDALLKDRHVLAVAGTHGKTTTTSLLTWILSCANLQPGYLIGGAPNNFPFSAELGKDPFFVIEADEYDTAFFDKHAKFMHYQPQTLILNNLEYDHADIFPDLEAIKREFQFLLRTVPSKGTVIFPNEDLNVREVLARGCYSQKISLGSPDSWRAELLQADASHFELWYADKKIGDVKWKMSGLHNVQNALAAIAAAHVVGIQVETSIEALQSFAGIKRRMEVRGQVQGITVYDDFAHHPTAIRTTLSGLRAKVNSERIFAVLELASNTMKMGVHHHQIADSLQTADQVLLLQPAQGDFLNPVVESLGSKVTVCENVAEIIQQLSQELKPQDHVLIMSNKGFDGIHQKLLNRLQEDSNDTY
jgi:UDP-N-acetylmuramate: L-alanyl-gamma-D-glutamyl-meso-diaminopimelate ligase